MNDVLCHSSLHSSRGSLHTEFTASLPVSTHRAEQQPHALPELPRAELERWTPGIPGELYIAVEMGSSEEAVVVLRRLGSTMTHSRLSRLRLRPAKASAKSKHLKRSSLQKKSRFV